MHIEKERGSQRRKPLTAGESGRRTRGRSLRRLRKKRGDGRSHQPPACVHPAPEGLRAESRVLPPAAPTAADTGRPGQRRGPSASTFCPDDQSDVPRLTLCGRGPSALLPESPHSVTLTGGRSRSGPGRKAGHRQRKRPLAPCTRPKTPTPSAYTPFHYQLGRPFSRKASCPGPRGQGVPPGVTQHRPQSPALGPAQGGRD